MEIKEMKEIRLPKRRQPVFKLVKRILRLFMRVEVEIGCDDLPECAIIVSNHSAKSGPLAFELYYPHFHATWGAHEMLGGYSSRFHYLRDVFYIRKQGKGRLSATVRAAFEALFSKMFYKGIKILPTYTDMRFLYTVRSSMELLSEGASLLIFPENSSRGYLDELTDAFPGFVMLAEQYLNKTGVDSPIVSAYYHRKSKKMIVEAPEYVGRLLENGMKRKEIAEYFKERINEIYRREFKVKKDDQIQTEAR